MIFGLVTCQIEDEKVAFNLAMHKGLFWTFAGFDEQIEETLAARAVTKVVLRLRRNCFVKVTMHFCVKKVPTLMRR